MDFIGHIIESVFLSLKWNTRLRSVWIQLAIWLQNLTHTLLLATIISFTPAEEETILIPLSYQIILMLNWLKLQRQIAKEPVANEDSSIEHDGTSARNNDVVGTNRDDVQTDREEHGSTQSSDMDRFSETNDSEYRYGDSRGPSMAAIAEVSASDYEFLADRIGELGNIFFDYVNGKDIKRTWRYLSDVIQYETNESRDQIIRVLSDYGRARRNGMFGFSVEEDHIHVIHDCAFSGQHCRDVWRREVEPFGIIRPARTENKPIWKFTATDWFDVFIYFFLKKWGTREIWIRGKGWQTPTDGR